MNPAAMMKLMEAKNRFDSDHPGFARFLNDLVRNGVEADSVIEISIKKPDGSNMVTNMKVNQSDIDLINAIKGIGM